MTDGEFLAAVQRLTSFATVNCWPIRHNGFFVQDLKESQWKIRLAASSRPTALEPLYRIGRLIEQDKLGYKTLEKALEFSRLYYLTYVETRVIHIYRVKERIVRTVFSYVPDEEARLQRVQRCLER